jgi:hypothetical protein
MGKNMGREFDNLFRMTPDYKWRTKAHGRFVGAGSRLNLPDPLFPATYQELEKHLKKGGK